MKSNKRHRYPNPLSDDQMNKIVKNVSSYFNAASEEVIGFSKKPVVLDARMYIVGILRLYHGLSLRQISELLSDRNHATIIYIYNKFMGLKTCKVKHIKDEVELIYSELSTQGIK
jgi:chromosomal replication initiation ATPase DnaA